MGFNEQHCIHCAVACVLNTALSVQQGCSEDGEPENPSRPLCTLTQRLKYSTEGWSIAQHPENQCHLGRWRRRERERAKGELWDY